MAQYINATELRPLLKTERLFIIDVRDADHEGGHISGSLNIQASEFIGYSSSRATCQSLLETIEKSPSPSGTKWLCVFHCMESQVRGPKCARIFRDYLKESGKSFDDDQVVVLRQGFRGWAHTYLNDKEAIDELNVDYWKSIIAEDNM